MGSTIFVIDSSPAVHRMVEQLSMPDGHTVRGFHDGPSALEAARAQSPALIIADYHLEKITFSGFCKEIGRQDNLAETLIISMVDAADRLDESKLRSLGVRAFLKKPFQREQLLETINTILTGTAGRPTAKPAKARTWPPVSTGTDDEDEQELPLDTAADEPPRHEREKEQATMSPLPTQPVLASTSSSSRSKGEELM
ncbi:MAG TPA: response regulator, partial [Nitrospira sp.]|nr:response regulator [Nitrospira sp.]